MKMRPVGETAMLPSTEPSVATTSRPSGPRRGAPSVTRTGMGGSVRPAAYQTIDATSNRSAPTGRLLRIGIVGEHERRAFACRPGERTRPTEAVAVRELHVQRFDEREAPEQK